MSLCIEYYYNNTLFNPIFNFLSYLACSFNSHDHSIYYNYEYEKYNNLDTLNNYNEKLEIIKNNYINNYPNIYYFFLTSAIVILSDGFLLVLFGLKARWFQLHSLINFLIVIYIIKDYIQILIDPNNGYETLNNHYVSYLILNLHLFHILTFKHLGFYDYFHHILFVGLGVLPTIVYIKTNQCYMGYISCSGIPGVIEYFVLALYKNNKISLNTQKLINSINYNYFRFPLCIIGVTYNFIHYNNKTFIDNYLMTIYINILLFLNGSLFNYLTLGSYFKKKYNKII